MLSEFTSVRAGRGAPLLPSWHCCTHLMMASLRISYGHGIIFRGVCWLSAFKVPKDGNVLSAFWNVLCFHNLDLTTFWETDDWNSSRKCCLKLTCGQTGLSDCPALACLPHYFKGSVSVVISTHDVSFLYFLNKYYFLANSKIILESLREKTPSYKKNEYIN